MGYIYAYHSDGKEAYIFPNSMTFMYDTATQYFWCGEYLTTELYDQCKANITNIRNQFDKFDFYIVYSIIKNNKVTFGYSFKLDIIRLAAVKDVVASIKNNVFYMSLTYFTPDCYFNGNRRIQVQIYG